MRRLLGSLPSELEDAQPLENRRRLKLGRRNELATK
jgi:hypothetical protein